MGLMTGNTPVSDLILDGQSVSLWVGGSQPVKVWPTIDPLQILRVGVASGAAYGPLRDWAASIGETHETITEITVPVEVVGPSLEELFFDCKALTSIPAMDTSQVRHMYAMFYSCQALTTIPALDTGQVVNMYVAFSNCSSLTTIPELNTSSVKDMGYAFEHCTSLVTVPALNTSQVTNPGGMFYNCSSLTAVTLPGMGNGFTTTQTLDMSTTALDAAAANALMQSLGTPPPGGTLQLPSTATGANVSIATAKNWQVTIG